jgi:branched-chain amino acid aminotransferase
MRIMPLSIYVDGRFVNRREDATVPLYDHGLLYGDGIFEGIRSYEGRVFRLGAHLDRLYGSARCLRIVIPITPAEMEALVVETCRRSAERNLYIRLVITRGVGDMGIDPRKCTGRPGIYIIAGAIQLYAPEKYEKGLNVVTVATRRNRPDSLPPQVKSLNYLNNVMGRLEANRVGADEGIMLNDAGYVTEATADNVFIVRGGEILTPSSHYGILEGITRGVVLDLARELGIPALETGLILPDLIRADEIFLSGTGAELIPVVSFDGLPVGDGRPGPVFRRLLEAFRALTRVEGVPYLATADQHVVS